MEYWKKVNPDGTIRTVESHSHHHSVSDALKITEEEYSSFTASLPKPPPPKPPRDLAQELDELKARIDKLEEI